MESGKMKRTAETESAVRRSDDSEVDRDGENTDTATEHEVEEFFAILKRMQVARKYLKRSYGDSGDPAAAKRWRQAFEAEDFGEFEGTEEKAEENKDDRSEIGVAVAEGPSPNAKLDLNCAPANGDVL